MEKEECYQSIQNLFIKMLDKVDGVLSTKEQQQISTNLVYEKKGFSTIAVYIFPPDWSLSVAVFVNLIWSWF